MEPEMRQTGELMLKPEAHHRKGFADISIWEGYKISRRTHPDGL